MTEKLFYQDKYGQHNYATISGMLFTDISASQKMIVRGGATLKNPAGMGRYIYSDIAYEFGNRRGWTNEKTEQYFEKFMLLAAEDMKDLI